MTCVFATSTALLPVFDSRQSIARFARMTSWITSGCRATSPVNGQFDVPAGGQVKVPTLCGMFLGWRYLRSVCHAVGVAVGDDDGGVVQEPVEDAGGGGVFGEESSPLFEGPVAGDRE